MRPHLFSILAALALATNTLACDNGNGPEPLDPDTAPRASIDRFSEAAAVLFVRTASNGLPAANAPVNFDQGPFITQGLGPAGQVVRYYNFDVMSTTPAPIYVLFREGDDSPVSGQLNIVDVIPGDADYNDFWRVVKVNVPKDYEANTATSLADLTQAGYQMTVTDMLVNCPIVPDGSTASMRLAGEDPGLARGWYRGKVVFYFTFAERALSVTGGNVPTSPIYVSFNINPDQSGGGPPSGFKTEPSTSQTHNVTATVPSDAGYSPLWLVNAYDNADFDTVSDLTSAQAATILGAGVAIVNCPIVFVGS